MKSVSERITEFVDYHINGDGECNNVILKWYADKHNLSPQQRYEIAFLFSMCYSVPSAIIMYNACNQGVTLESLKPIKSRVIFQSDRKYMKMKDNFERGVKCFVENNSDYEKFKNDVCVEGLIGLAHAIRKVQSWVMFGRFGAFLFLETLCALEDVRVVDTTMKWSQGDTATSGIMNLFGKDSEANLFDKTGKLLIKGEQLDYYLSVVKLALKKAGCDTNIAEIETSLCAYRKFYKGSRYNGYYLDRMLEEIHNIEAEYADIACELYEGRKKNFAAKFLGEISGWKGIRKEEKKRYMLTGRID